jgi:hypothetical protein
MPSYSLEQDIGSMKHGDERHYSANDKAVKVTYSAEQAMGDNGQPAKGYTVGHFGVHGPGDDDYASFRHSPHGPTLEGAKPYAAKQAADRISRVFRDRRS